MATIIFKVTECCNSNCVYCDVVRNHSGRSMSLDILEVLFVRINEYLITNPKESIHLIWHGGEPLLVGPDYFNTAADLMHKHCPETLIRIKHDLQSNLTLFDESFVEPLRRLGINGIGSSYDPEPHIRGSGLAVDSETYNRRFYNGIRCCDRFGLTYGIIYVVTKKSLKTPLKVFYYLTNLKIDGSVCINPVLIYDEQRKDIAITPEEYVGFIGEIFPVWWKYKHRFPNVDPFKTLSENILNRKQTLVCNDSGSCAFSYVTVSPDGEASHCGRSADWNILTYGNIQTSTLNTILNDPQRFHLAKRSSILQKSDCRECRFWTICHGGCPLDAITNNGDFMHKSHWCEAKKGFIERYFEPITGLKFEPFKS